jgi:inner membrane protein
MLLPNHLIGGFVFSGIVGGFMGENLFESPASMTTVLIGSVIADIDLPTSPIGKIFKPISVMINNRFGHRTITHSFLAIAATTAIFSIFLTPIGFHGLYWFISYFSHCLFDMLTVQGVPFLFPLLKNNWVIPGDSNLRFNTGDIKSESITFASFLTLGIFTFPMMKTGFWTSYNSSFGTQKHIASEFEKSKDILEVDYSYQIGSQEFKGKGLCIDASTDKTILRVGSEWLTLDPSVMHINSVNFKHTNRPFFIETSAFINVGIDSLNQIVSEKGNNQIIELEVQSNGTAKVTEKGIQTDFKTYKKTYPSVLSFFVRDSSYQRRTFNDLPSLSPRMKRSEIQTIKDEYELKKRKFENAQLELRSLLTDSTRDNLTRERNYIRIKELRSDKPPELDLIRIHQLEFEASQVEQNDLLQLNIRKSEFERNEDDKAKQITKVYFSGFVKKLRIE